MGMTAIVFGASSDEEAAAVLELDEEPDGFDCDLMPDELWELEGVLLGVPGSEVPVSAEEPIAEVDDFALFVMPVNSELGSLLAAAGPRLSTWAADDAVETVETLTRTLIEIRGSGRTPYLFVVA